jgi:hypothetical protein
VSAEPYWETVVRKLKEQEAADAAAKQADGAYEHLKLSIADAAVRFYRAYRGAAPAHEYTRSWDDLERLVKAYEGRK